ncbi:MAG: ATP-binding protein [Hyphomicrobiales bacterium]|nr:ATP-binding protein [Hyphomicrobiales bacterium]
MTGNSLARRFFLLAALWSLVSLAVAGFVLIAVYRDFVERSFDDRLAVRMKTLVAGLADQADVGGFRAPADLGEARFDVPLSGWYWVVRRVGDERIVLASPSLTGEILRLPSDDGATVARGRVAVAYVDGPDLQHLRVLERTVDFDGTNEFRLAVAADAGELDRDVAGFRWRAIAVLGLVGFGSVASALFQVRLALAPLERMRRALARIRTGEAARFDDDLPNEIAPLAHELDALVDANREAMERARTHVGNLAHALKTPLAVLVNEARGLDTPLARHVVEQADLMSGHVQHHLDRARLAAQRRVIGVVTEVEPVIERMARAMRRIHADRDLTIDVAVAPGLRFRGEREDFEEALGNLVDNACKWCRGRVAISAEIEEAADRAVAPRLLLVVEDDGPGLPPEARAKALERGRRLDETVPGSGLGLSIVVETARLYGGSFELGASRLGGLECRLRLPAL